VQEDAALWVATQAVASPGIFGTRDLADLFFIEKLYGDEPSPRAVRQSAGARYASAIDIFSLARLKGF